MKKQDILKYMYLKYWSTDTYSQSQKFLIQSKRLPVQVVFHETTNTSCNLGLEPLNQVASSRPVFLCFEMTLYLKNQSCQCFLHLLVDCPVRGFCQQGRTRQVLALRISKVNWMTPVLFDVLKCSLVFTEATRWWVNIISNNLVSVLGTAAVFSKCRTLQNVDSNSIWKINSTDYFFIINYTPSSAPK